MSEPNTMHQTMNNVTNGVAGVGVTLPWWHEIVGQVSDFAAEWVPILSLAWLAVQFGGLVLRMVRQHRGRHRRGN